MSAMKSALKERLVKRLRKEVMVLEAEIIFLEKEKLPSLVLPQILRNWLVSSPIEKLEQTQFELKLKEALLSAL